MVGPPNMCIRALRRGGLCPLLTHDANTDGILIQGEGGKGSHPLPLSSKMMLARQKLLVDGYNRLVHAHSCRLCVHMRVDSLSSKQSHLLTHLPSFFRERLWIQLEEPSVSVAGDGVRDIQSERPNPNTNARSSCDRQRAPWLCTPTITKDAKHTLQP